MMWKSKGFTLIEMIVVVFIIGTLAALIIVNVAEQRKVARDAKRKSDIMTIKTALEMYYEQNGYYPPCTYNDPSSDDFDYCFNRGYASSYLEGVLTPKYLQKVPVDPSTASNYHYYYVVNPNVKDSNGASIGGTGYALRVQFETITFPNPNNQTTIFCKTGVNMNPSWWSNAAVCDF